MFSDHPAGVNVLMCDGSVQYLVENMDHQVVLAMLTRASEILNGRPEE